MSWFLSSSFHYWVLISKWNHLHPSISFLITLISLYGYIIQGCILSSLVSVTLQTDGILPEKKHLTLPGHFEMILMRQWLLFFFPWPWLSYSFQTLKTERRELWTQHSFMFYTPLFSVLVPLRARSGPWVQLCSLQSFLYHSSFLASSQLLVSTLLWSCLLK